MVVTAGVPRRTAGQDSVQCVSLADPSLQEDAAVVFNIFRASPASFPALLPGDVLRLHRAEIQSYAQGRLGGTVKEKRSHFVCLRPAGGERETEAELVPFYQSSDSRLTRRPQRSTAPPPASASPSPCAGCAALRLLPAGRGGGAGPDALGQQAGSGRRRRRRGRC